jgi:hypothetical protein
MYQKIKQFTAFAIRIFVILLFALTNGSAQPERWQQGAKYEMDIDFDVKKHQFKGYQKMILTNNSPDTLDKVFYHLYFNAFQPNSMMDVRSRTILDPDRRVGDRISKLKSDEQGFIKVSSLKMDGKKVLHKTVGTILEVKLSNPVLPHTQAVFEMNFTGQVPEQIRRSGRNNAEGIEYSMAQWYPKMCNYDYQGWHSNPYVGREFYGIWGDFDVKISMPSNYVLAGTGTLQNPKETGYGYASTDPVSRPTKLTWHFKAQNVHDFVWAADPDYKQIVHKNRDGTTVRYFYQPGEKTSDNWERLPAIMDEAFEYINTHYGKYPFSEYSFIQGGDGGMEYPMATLITGQRSLISLVGVSIHELMHSWFQMVLGSNEALYHWMDEGFTSYASNAVMNHLKKKKLIPGDAVDNPHLQDVKGYVNFALSGKEEPLITHADHFMTNTAYGVASYTKGSALLEQLRYIIGEKNFDKSMLMYFETWKFKHPNTNDFFRIMEKASGLELDWFKEYFVHTTHRINYAIEDVKGKMVILQNKGLVPMPLDITVKTKDGKMYQYYIPQELMRGEKKDDKVFRDAVLLPDWAWTHPEYSFEIKQKPSDVESIEIDVSGRMADADRNDNVWPQKAAPK